MPAERWAVQFLFTALDCLRPAGPKYTGSVAAIGTLTVNRAAAAVSSLIVTTRAVSVLFVNTSEIGS